SLVAAVERAFGPDGALARRWPEWESRAGQVELALAVARTLEDGGVLLAEAPTGVGKSLAYLLPTALHAVATGQRVGVATWSRSLQDKLFGRDLPALLEALELKLPVAMLKGKQNYLCPRALEIAGADTEPELFVLERLRAWAVDDPTGDLDRFDH